MIYPRNPYCPFDKDYMRPGNGNNGNNNNNNTGNGSGGNVGGGNMGGGNMGGGNMGGGNMGSGNMGSGNMGGGNMGGGNMGSGNMGSGNMGSGNMGSGNMGSGNMGSGNMGNGNMGNGCIGNGNMGNESGSTGNMNRSELMQYISELEFALTDLNLYLDTHPDNAEALEMFTKLAATLKSLKSDYARRFAPITAMDVRNEIPFDWVSSEHKWPWQA